MDYYVIDTARISVPIGHWFLSVHSFGYDIGSGYVSSNCWVGYLDLVFC